MFPPGFFVVHDATRGSHNDITEIKIRKCEFLLEKFREIDWFHGKFSPIIRNHKDSLNKLYVFIIWNLLSLKIFREINTISRMLNSRNFCESWARVKIFNFHTVLIRTFRETHPNWREGNKLLVHFSMSLIPTSNPHNDVEKLKKV